MSEDPAGPAAVPPGLEANTQILANPSATPTPPLCGSVGEPDKTSQEPVES